MWRRLQSSAHGEIMKASRLLILGVLLMLGFVSAFAQNDPTLDTGFKPYSSYQGGDLDSVNLSNGNLVLHIPLSGYAQRGSPRYTPQIIYNNKGWYVVPNCNSVTSACSPYWAFGTGVTPPGETPGNGIILDFGTDNTIAITWQPQSPGSSGLLFTATTSDGSTHQFVPNQAGGMSSLDGTDLWYDGSNPTNGVPGKRRDSQGNTASGSSVYLEDPNGNIISGSTDTLRRSMPNTLSSFDASGCTGPFAITSGAILSFPGFNG